MNIIHTQIYIWGIYVYIYFFFILNNTPTYAENMLEITKCEEQIIRAFSESERIMNKNFSQYLEIPEVTSIAKSQNIASYDRTYQCYNKAICFAMRNPTPEIILPKNLGECNNLKTVGDLQAELHADFSQCNSQFIQSTHILWKRCEVFAEKKNRRGRNYFAVEFIKETSLQNRSLLGTKIFEIRKRMAVLLKKTRQFTTHFIKVRNDISCSIPDSSGYQK